MKTLLIFLCSMTSLIAQNNKSWGLTLGKTLSHINNFDNPDKSIRSILSLHNIRKEPHWSNQISIFYQSVEKHQTQFYSAVGFNGMGQHFFDIENIDNGLDNPTWVDKTVKQYYFFAQEGINIAVSPKINVSAGFQLQYLWDESLDVLIELYDIHTSNFVKAKYSAGLDVIYKKWDYGIKIGLNYRLSQHFFLICTYYQGLKRIDLPEFKYLHPRTNASLGVGIGVNFSSKLPIN